MQCTLSHGDSLEVLKSMPDFSIDSLVTDPPGGIGFMSNGSKEYWDSDRGGRDQWVSWLSGIMTESFRVLKPGAFGLVWAYPKTIHWTMLAMERSGFQIRDIITHLYKTGMPKSYDVGKAIDKELGCKREIIGTHQGSGMTRANKKHGAQKRLTTSWNIYSDEPASDAAASYKGYGTALKPASEFWILVRKPFSEKNMAANVLKWGTGCLNTSALQNGGRFPANVVVDEIVEEELAFNFFFCPKASAKDKGVDNPHPTTKSTVLMAELVKLVTPKGGVVLDPFLGSGSTGLAALRGGYRFIGVDACEEYVRYASQRLSALAAAEDLLNAG